MKKILFCLAVAVVTLSCRGGNGECALFGDGSKMTALHAEICSGDATIKEDETVNSADLRLKLFCEITTIKNATYQRSNNGTEFDEWCAKENMGLDPALAGISLTCDSPIANIEAGADLLSVIRPRVVVKDQYDWSLEEWLKILNDGFIVNNNGREISLTPNMTYEFEIAFLPYFVTVAPGDYTFRLTMNFGWETLGNASTYSGTFSNIRIK
jgi:hypothetical protein